MTGFKLQAVNRGLNKQLPGELQRGREVFFFERSGNLYDATRYRNINTYTEKDKKKKMTINHSEV